MCKAMIVSIGGTAAPITTAIKWYAPEFVSFYASQETCGQVAAIQNEIALAGLKIAAKLTLVDDVNDLLHCHGLAEKAIRYVLDAGYPKEDVVVDYTGGTKNMSVALSLAAIPYGFCFSYVGGAMRTKDGIGVVVNGEERVFRNVNPWDFLALDERKKINLLFNRFQFSAARELIGILQEKGPRKRRMYRKIGFAIEGYSQWDLFSHQEAQGRFKRACLEELAEEEDSSVRRFAKQTTTLLPFLDKLAQHGQKPSPGHVLDLFANAERRFFEGKIDDAILRLYRLVEMAAQERLASGYCINASDVKAEQLPPQISEKFIRLYRSPRDGRIKIPQSAAFELLESLNDELGQLFIQENNVSRFKDIQKSRNDSYLAHGLCHSRPQVYSKFRGFILGLGLFNPEESPSFPTLEL